MSDSPTASLKVDHENPPRCPDCGARLEVHDDVCYVCPDNCGWYHVDELAEREPWSDPENLEGKGRSAKEIAATHKELDRLYPTQGDKLRLMFGLPKLTAEQPERKSTPTPRTDGLWATCLGQYPHSRGEVMRDHARTLERDLAATASRESALRAELKKWENDSACLPEDQSITETVSALRADRDSHQRVCIRTMEENDRLRAALEEIRAELTPRYRPAYARRLVDAALSETLAGIAESPLVVAVRAHLEGFNWMDGPEGWLESMQALRHALPAAPNQKEVGE